MTTPSTGATVKNWLDAIRDVTLPPLQSGAHDSPQTGVCAMEMVAFMERLPHSDSPPCTCRVIATFVRGLNDLLPDSERGRLLPYLPRLVDTVSRAHEQERGEYLAWAAITVFAPAALRAAKMFNHADALANFDKAQGLTAAAAWAASAARDARAALRAARAAAASAASAAWAASAASRAARAAAASAASAAAWAARGAAWAAAASAASAAAWAASAVYDDCFHVLNGVLSIGPQSKGFANVERVRELADLGR